MSFALITKQAGSPAILSREQKRLTPDERRILLRIRNKKLFFIISAYTSFLGILILGWIYGWLRSFKFGEGETERFTRVVPFLMIFFFLVLTIFFIRYYRQTTHPFFKDLKEGIKELIYFEPEGYKTPFFETYYIKTISRKRAMVRISKDLYQSIQPGSRACICLSLHARFVFSIHVDDQYIRFNERNSILEL